MDNKIKQIAEEFSIKNVVDISRFGNGLINDTYLVESSKTKYVMQKLHPIFKPTVLLDTHSITQYLSANGIRTPVITPTKKGKLFIKDENGACWRMITYIPGRCYENGISPSRALSAGKLVGQFHNVLSGFGYKFKHVINNFHNAESRIKKLNIALNKFKNTEKYKKLAKPAGVVLKNYAKLGNMVDACPDRITHGDLKINNVRFDYRGKAVCLLDLDTLGRGKISADLAGAARTWCNRADEGDVKNSEFNTGAFEQMLAGYLSTAKFITAREIETIPEAVERCILTLAVRFITDAFEEKYFRLNSRQYKNLYEQNKTKALAQLALYNDFISKKKQVIKLCKQ